MKWLLRIAPGFVLALVAGCGGGGSPTTPLELPKGPPMGMSGDQKTSKMQFEAPKP